MGFLLPRCVFVLSYLLTHNAHSIYFIFCILAVLFVMFCLVSFTSKLSNSPSWKLIRIGKEAHHTLWWRTFILTVAGDVNMFGVIPPPINCAACVLVAVPPTRPRPVLDIEPGCIFGWPPDTQANETYKLFDVFFLSRTKWLRMKWVYGTNALFYYCVRHALRATFKKYKGNDSKWVCR